MAEDFPTPLIHLRELYAVSTMCGLKAAYPVDFSIVNTHVIDFGTCPQCLYVAAREVNIDNNEMVYHVVPVAARTKHTPYDENPLPRKGPIMDKNQDVSVARAEIIAGCIGIITIAVLYKRIGHLKKDLRNVKLIAEANKAAANRMLKMMTHSQTNEIKRELNTNAEFVGIVIHNF